MLNDEAMSRARAALRSNQPQNAVAVLLNAAGQTHLQARDYDEMLRLLAEALQQVGQLRAAATVWMYLRDARRVQQLSGNEPRDLGRAAISGFAVFLPRAGVGQKHDHEGERTGRTHNDDVTARANRIHTRHHGKQCNLQLMCLADRARARNRSSRFLCGVRSLSQPRKRCPHTVRPRRCAPQITAKSPATILEQHHAAR